MDVSKRAYNFCAGPAALPEAVLQRAQGELLDWHGKGLAQALMDACIGELRRQNADAVWLGVWEHNPRAIAFYRKCGFTEVGEHVFVLGEDPQRDVVMVKPLPAP